MAQLKSVIDELDLINEKLEKMKGLLKDAIEGFAELQTRAAEHRNEADREQACPLCKGKGTYLTEFGLQTCGHCDGYGHT